VIFGFTILARVDVSTKVALDRFGKNGVLQSFDFGCRTIE